MSTLKLKSQIKIIIKEEMNSLVDKISNDFKNNYNRKSNNWTLKEFDSTLVANMVFVSSFESKSGNMFEMIAKRICELELGKKNVPRVLKGFGVSQEEYNDYLSKYNDEKQVIITKVDQSACQEFLTGFKEKHVAEGRGRNRNPCSLTQKSLSEITDHSFICTTNITEKPVDLAIFDEKKNMYYLFEIKAGGDLDSSNAPGNVLKMLTEYAVFGKPNSNLFFATIYNKNGEEKNWTGAIKKYFAADILLIGKDFWEFILKSITFQEFKELYNEAATELDINKKINDLINNID